MITYAKYAGLGNVGNPDFDWSLYENGWNGTSLKINKKVKTKNSSEKIYCHESYAQDLYNTMSGIKVENAKDIKKGGMVAISDIRVIDDNTIMATVGGGASNLIVDLNKEGRFFSLLSYGGEIMNKQSFVKTLKENPEFKRQVLSMDLTAKVGTDTERGSIWDGYVEKMTNELKEQITNNNNAYYYYAEILSTNGGGFVVEVAGTIKAFMPGSMAASNRISDYDSYIGKTLEVMVESWSPKYGFVVSRKKYLNKIRPIKLKPIEDTLKSAPDTVYTGKVTGSNQFGVFVELNEFVTGMLHKTLVSDSLRQAMRDGTVESGSDITVYVHKIENGRVILSDVNTAERPAIIAKREAEDNAEKSEHIAQKNNSRSSSTESTNNYQTQPSQVQE